MKTLHMVLDGHDVGQLVQDNHGTTRVTANPTRGLPRVSLAFAPSDTPVKPLATRAYLAGLLPDDPATRRRISKEFHVSAESQFALMSVIGADCPGAIQFLTEQQMQEPRPGDLEPISDGEIAQRLKRLRAGRSAWGASDEHWSLGGAQAKMALRLEDGAWHRALGTSATSHIIKPGIEKLRSQALLEHISLRALGLLELRVARSAFVHFEDEPAIVVERFDRLRDHDGSLRRAHQEDLCQSTSTLPDAKYDVTSERVVQTLRGGGASEDTIREFARAVIANWVLAAPDGHAKNYSVFLDSAGVAALTPLYDVATGLGYPGYDEVAMGFAGEKAMHRITGRHLLTFASAVGIDGESVLASAASLAELLPAAFLAATYEAAAAVSIPDEDQRWLGETAEKLVAHCEHVQTVLEQTA